MVTVTYGYLNLLKKILCRNLLIHRPNNSNCGIVAPGKATLFKMDNIFPAFLFTARGMLSKRSADRIGMRTVTPDREREIELAHELMTIGFFFLCSLKILAQEATRSPAGGSLFLKPLLLQTLRRGYVGPACHCQSWQ